MALMVIMVINEIVGDNDTTRPDTLFPVNNIISSSKTKLDMPCFGRTKTYATSQAYALLRPQLNYSTHRVQKGERCTPSVPWRGKIIRSGRVRSFAVGGVGPFRFVLVLVRVVYVARFFPVVRRLMDNLRLPFSTP